jgi:hypothetical protein
MSLKDVIMTLNEFYQVKLDNVHKLVLCVKSPEKESQEHVEKIEKIVKDNEVRIPYDEDIFIGIDKNYKTLKRILVTVKEIYNQKFDYLSSNEVLVESLRG